MFGAAFFTVAERQEKTKCPWMDGWMNGLKKWNLYRQWSISHKKEGNYGTCYNMDEP